VICDLFCPDGFVRDANGCETCRCAPGDCSRHASFSVCNADPSCTWLRPGCGEPALAAQGCYAQKDVGCASDAECGGRRCLKRVVDPCYNPSGGPTCAACGLTETICL
jgi:hypothetical protein